LEISDWQESYRVYAADDIYVGQAGKELLKKSLEGKSEAGDEAWRMKFTIRISKNPIFMDFDAKIINREVGDSVAGNTYLVSVSGIDFAARKHDVLDIKNYIKNWDEAFENQNGNMVIYRGRDFIPTGVRLDLDRQLVFNDLLKMARVRLRAQDAVGINIVGETGIGLGVFSGDKYLKRKYSKTFEWSCLPFRFSSETKKTIITILCRNFSPIRVFFPC